MSRFPAGSLVAVTGANGFIGSHIVQQLLAKGYRVRAIVRDPSNAAKVNHLKALPHSDRLELAKGELSEEDYTRAFAGAAAVIHAASPYIYTAEDADRDIVQPAIRGTLAALNAAVANKVQRVVVTSSTAAVMFHPLPHENYKFSDKDWNLAATVANGPYMLSKRLAEQAAWDFAKAHKEVEVVAINPCLVFGPSIAGENNINTSITNLRMLLMGEPNPFIPLNSYRPIVDVRDVAAAHLIGLEHPNARDQRLIVTAEVICWSDLAAMLKRLFPKFPNTTPLPETKPAPYSVDVSPLATLGLRNYIGAEQMVKETVEAMIANNLVPRV